MSSVISHLLDMDSGLLLIIQEHLRNPFLTSFFTKVTHLGDGGILWVILTLILLAFPKTRRAGICSACGLLICFCINNLMLKNLVARVRPYKVIPELILLIKESNEYSFPSGHAAIAFASATSLYLYLPAILDRKKLRIIGFCLYFTAVLIAFSRLYVGIHYPSDVIFGMISGAICGYAGYRIGRILIQKFPRL